MIVGLGPGIEASQFYTQKITDIQCQDTKRYSLIHDTTVFCLYENPKKRKMVADERVIKREVFLGEKYAFIPSNIRNEVTLGDFSRAFQRVISEL